jgi:hypothetical protein
VAAIKVILLLAGQAMTVGGFDTEPPVAVAQGGPDLRTDVASALKRCDVSETWEYDDVLWAHSYDLTPKKLACLAKATGRPIEPAQARDHRSSID